MSRTVRALVTGAAAVAVAGAVAPGAHAAADPDPTEKLGKATAEALGTVYSTGHQTVTSGQFTPPIAT
jgi:hypothetical protein